MKIIGQVFASAAAAKRGLEAAGYALVQRGGYSWFEKAGAADVYIGERHIEWKGGHQWERLPGRVICAVQ